MVVKEYKEELRVPSCGASCYYYLGVTKSHQWELSVWFFLISSRPSLEEMLENYLMNK